MTHYRGQLLAIANVIPIRKVILRPDSLQYALTIVQTPRRPRLLNNIEDDGPLLVRSRLTANDVNGELLFTRAQSWQNIKGSVDVLLCSNGLVEQAFETAVEKHQYRQLVELHYQRRVIRTMLVIIWDFWDS
jgi:hypothetical protein